METTNIMRKMNMDPNNAFKVYKININFRKNPAYQNTYQKCHNTHLPKSVTT